MNKGDTAWPYDGYKDCIEYRFTQFMITYLNCFRGRVHVGLIHGSFPYFCLAIKGLECPILIFDLRAHGFIYPFRVH